MTQYQYTALDQNSHRKKGMIEANNKEQALDFLMAQSLSPLQLQQVSQSTQSFLQFSSKQSLLSAKTAGRFAGNLAKMLKAGLPLAQALSFLSEEDLDKQSRALAGFCVKSVKRGTPLSTTLERQGNGVVQELASLVKAGESTGNLAESLDEAAVGFQRTAELQERIRGAFIYPLVVFSIVVLTLMVFFFIVMPKLRSIFDGIEGGLPLSTRILLSSGDFFEQHGWLVLLGLLIAVLFVIFSESSKKMVRKVFQTLSLSPLGLGIAPRLIYAGFARRMSAMLSAGVPPTHAITTAAQAIGNQPIQTGLLKAAENVRKGTPIAVCFQSLPFAPPLFTSLVRMGIKTGKLADALRDTANALEQDADTRIEKLVAALGPGITVLVGALTAFVVIGLFAGLASLSEIEL